VSHSLNLRDLTRNALERLLQQALLKDDDDLKKKAADMADEDQNDLADLHAEGKGDSKPPKVEKDDLPAHLRGDDDEDEKEEETENDRDEPVKSPFKKGKKKPPFEKAKKGTFPFQKKKG
jgi:hypothetical protein